MPGLSPGDAPALKRATSRRMGPVGHTIWWERGTARRSVPLRCCRDLLARQGYAGGSYFCVSFLLASGGGAVPFQIVAVERCHSRLWRWGGAIADRGGGAVPFQIVAVERCHSRSWRWSGAIPDCGGGAVPFQILT
ncbi:hypothetical protein H6P81_011805 [Aristolochia fimbriata]|uniref:Uncharacterized protein n=1 Tax=Aristolochia fimbriata TaxID=158543 RepID=A0AAV7EDT0_ARIFI|nr:hypothetical protein H6P81_011805 [Aristolochia fimbriata]